MPFVDGDRALGLGGQVVKGPRGGKARRDDRRVDVVVGDVGKAHVPVGAVEIAGAYLDAGVRAVLQRREIDHGQGGHGCGSFLAKTAGAWP